MFKCPVRKSVRPVQVVEQGKIKRVRGVAWAVRVSPAVANRLVETAKGELLRFLPDVYIYTDHWAGARAGNSPGFGLTLTAETTTGCFLTAEVRLGGGQGLKFSIKKLDRNCIFISFLLITLRHPLPPAWPVSCR